MKYSKAAKKTAVAPKTTIPTEEPRCNPPLDREQCCVVAHWEGFDGHWEQLLYNRCACVFYLNWSWCEPCDVKLSEALHWYACKRALDCDHGELSWPNLSELLGACVRELQDLEALGVSPGVEFDLSGRVKVGGTLAVRLRQAAELAGKEPGQYLDEAIAEKLARMGKGAKLLAA